MHLSRCITDLSSLLSMNLFTSPNPPQLYYELLAFSSDENSRFMGKSRESKMMVTVPSQYISSRNDYTSIHRRQELPIKLANNKNTVCFEVRMTFKKMKLMKA